MKGRDFHRLAKRAPDIMTSLRNLSLRRDFKKAVVHRLKKEFPYDNPREAFDAVKLDKNRQNLNVEDVTQLMRELNPNYTKAEILEIIRVLALTKSEDVSFDEFKKVFIADVRLSASV
jgi:Ca2+-binding EF-hand superfamily protein